MDSIYSKTHLRIRILGLGMAIMGCVWFFLNMRSAGLLFASWGFILLCCPHTYAVYQITRVILAILTIGSVFWVYYSLMLDPNRIMQIYFLISGVFYLGFFLYILKRDVKEAFNPPRRHRVILEASIRSKIKVIIRGIAFVILARGVYFSHLIGLIQGTRKVTSGIWGLPQELIELAISVILFWGLFFFRQNLGRRLVMVLGVGAVLDGLMSLGKIGQYGSPKFFVIISSALFYFFVIIFLLLPKTKALFDKAETSVGMPESAGK